MQLSPFSTVTQTARLLQTWLKERQELIITLHHLCAQRPFLAQGENQILPLLQEFGQQLMDYIARGHFEIFEHITATVENSQQPQSEALAKLLGSLLETTQIALDFNDQYQSEQALTHLEEDLSYLAERLAQRFEWEDDLMNIATIASAWPMAKSA